jgi:uncharacterized membrane-anchored protein
MNIIITIIVFVVVSGFVIYDMYKTFFDTHHHNPHSPDEKDCKCGKHKH